MDEKPQTYKIVRFYRDRKARDREVQKRGLTLGQAHEHCSRPDTVAKDGSWFDGYVKERDQ